MRALERGKHAPDIQLPMIDSRDFFLAQALYQGPVVAVFFKISCPVCQFALPYMERIHQAAKGKNVTVIGVSQNTKKDTEFFARQYGITFPIALDNPKNYVVSNAYGITNVPTVFYVAPDGTIDISSVGWSKADVEEIARRVSDHIRIASIPVIGSGEDVPAFRGG